MYEAVSQTTYTNLPYYPVQPPPNPNPPPTHYQPQPVPDPYSSYGHYPPPNYATYQPQPSYYPDPNAISSAIQPLQNEAFTSASYGAPMNMFGRFPKVARRKVKKPKVIPKKKSESQSVFCDLCKIECNSVQHYEKHLSGKNHNKALKKLYAPMIPTSGQSSQSGNNASKTGALGGEGGPGVSSVPANLEEKKQKLLDGGTTMLSLRLCTVCNIACNGEIAFSDHLIGKKHIAKLAIATFTAAAKKYAGGDLAFVKLSDRLSEERSARKLETTFVSWRTYTLPAEYSRQIQERALNGNPITNPQKPAVTNPQKPAVVGAAWCDVCKISCTSSDGLTIHRNGKKHKRNLEILRNSISDVPISMPSSKPLHAVAYVNIPASSSKPLHPVSNVTIPTSSSNPVGLLSLLSPPIAQVDTESVVGPMPESKLAKKKRARLQEPNDLESKKRKIMECGADANAVRTCDICNVVCNSATVFSAHLAGQKHASLVKQVEAGAATSNHVVTSLT
ncbi:hypothetical protein KSS87_000314 [Heliosperma pusillum]|nr:hypothetical protein KSS87_000314 [Heliosperma pusillum]